MNYLNIQTSQNVAIGYEIAGLGDRYVAALIDYLIFLAYLFAIGIILQIFDWWYFIDQNSLFILFIFLPISFYHLICEIFLDGQSIGKMVRKIKVVKIDGSQVSIASYLLRWLFRLIDIMITLGGLAVIAIITTKNGQRLGDIAAGTTVVSLKQSTKLEDNLLFLPDQNHLIRFPDVRDLTDKDIATIKEVLLRTNTMDNNQLLYELYNKVANLLTIKPDENESIEHFLQTIVTDYNQIHST